MFYTSLETRVRHISLAVFQPIQPYAWWSKIGIQNCAESLSSTKIIKILSQRICYLSQPIKHILNWIVGN